jgi:hypothetical protein
MKHSKKAKGRYEPIHIPLIGKKFTDQQIKDIQAIRDKAIENFIAHKGVEHIAPNVSGNPTLLDKRKFGWQRKQNQKD